MSTMVYFDTFQYVKKLKAAGFSEKQATAFVEVQQESLSECLDTTLATKADTSELKSELQRVESNLKSEIQECRSELRLLKWMVGFVFAAVMAQILEKFFT